MRKLVAALLLASTPLQAQDFANYSDEALRRELSQAAAVETVVMVPMRDGKRSATNIYPPKGASGRLPTILWKTPYNELGDNPRTIRAALKVSRSYAFVVQNERGRYYSEGE